jgi:GT2 family glycosyltransferase
MIGIGVTTRHRTKVLDLTLGYIWKFMPPNCKVVVCDDSQESDSIDGNKHSCKKFGFEYLHDGTRKGVAKNKNMCLRALQDCEHIFLFDDDCFPIREGWAEYVISCHEKSGVHHFNLLDPALHQLKSGHEYDGFVIQEHHMVGGVFMYITKEVVEKVGAFNKDYDVYGFEHASYTYRAFKAGLHNGLGINLTIKDLQTYLLSIDYASHRSNIHHNAYLRLCEIPSFKDMSVSSVTNADRDKSIANNHAILREDCNGPIYREL